MKDGYFSEGCIGESRATVDILFKSNIAIELKMIIDYNQK
jgi:hypothetical protein